MVVQQLITVPLVADSKVGESDSNASQTLNDSLDMLAQANGGHPIQYGTQVEVPDVLRMFVTWDSVDTHLNYHGTSGHKEFTDKIFPIFAGKPDGTHVDFSVNPDGLSKALSAPVTEIALFSFENGPPADYLKGAQQTLETWTAAPEAKECGILGYSLGLTHEEQQQEGLKGKRSVLVIGWESIEQHMAFRNKELFREHINGLRGGAKAIDMKHTIFKTYNRS